MKSRLMFSVALLILILARGAVAQTERYFTVWSYAENAPSGELQPADLEARRLGYWVLEFDDQGRTTRGTYRGASGIEWLSFRYVEAGDRVHADLYAADGGLIVRKSTPLHTRLPNWGSSD